MSRKPQNKRKRDTAYHPEMHTNIPLFANVRPKGIRGTCQFYLQQCAGSDKRNLQEDFMDFTNKDECARGRGKRDDGRDWRSWNGLSV